VSLSRKHLREIILEEFISIIDESIDVRGVEVEWGKRANKKPAISFNGRLYTISGPMGIPIEIEDMEYFEDPERLDLIATADFPWPAPDKKVTDSMRPKGIDAIVNGVRSEAEEFVVPGRHGMVKFKRA
jgi:hypothetical protein